MKKASLTGREPADCRAARAGREQGCFGRVCRRQGNLCGHGRTEYKSGYSRTGLRREPPALSQPERFHGRCAVGAIRSTTLCKLPSSVVWAQRSFQIAWHPASCRRTSVPSAVGSTLRRSLRRASSRSETRAAIYSADQARSRSTYRCSRASRLPRNAGWNSAPRHSTPSTHLSSTPFATTETDDQVAKRTKRRRRQTGRADFVGYKNRRGMAKVDRR